MIVREHNKVKEEEALANQYINLKNPGREGPLIFASANSVDVDDHSEYQPLENALRCGEYDKPDQVERENNRAFIPIQHSKLDEINVKGKKMYIYTCMNLLT